MIVTSPGGKSVTILNPWDRGVYSHGTSVSESRVESLTALFAASELRPEFHLIGKPSK